MQTGSPPDFKQSPSASGSGNLTSEDANSKLVEVVTVADVDDEKRFDDSCMQIWKLKFGHEAKFCSDFEHKVSSRV